MRVLISILVSTGCQGYRLRRRLQRSTVHLTDRYCFASSCKSPEEGSAPISANALSAPSNKAAETPTPSNEAITIACSVTLPACSEMTF